MSIFNISIIFTNHQHFSSMDSFLQYNKMGLQLPFHVIVQLVMHVNLSAKLDNTSLDMCCTERMSVLSGSLTGDWKVL